MKLARCCDLFSKSRKGLRITLTCSVVLIMIFCVSLPNSQFAYSYLLKKDIYADSPYGIEFNPSDGNLYVTEANSNSLSIVNPKTEKIVESIEVGSFPVDLAIDSAHDRIYVTNRGSNDLSIIDMNLRETIETIPIEENIWGVAVDPISNKIFVAGFDGNGILSIVDGNTLQVIDKLSISLGSLYQVAFNPSNSKLYVANQANESVTILDPNTHEIINDVKVRGQPFGLSIDKNNNNVYVTIGDNSLSIIDGTEDRQIKNIRMSGIGSAYEVDNDPDQNKIVVANYGARTVSILDSLTYDILQVISVREHPFGVAFDTKNNKIFTTIPNIDAISIITEDIDMNEKPVADAGPDQTVKSNDIVQLDGSNSTDPNGSSLTYNRIQTSGREVTLSDSTSPNPTFIAPEINEPSDIVFELIVTNEEGVISDPDDVIITVSPIATPPPEEQPRTIGNLVKSIIQNPLDVTNSIEAANEIENILTDGDRDNDHEACSLLKNLNTEVATTLRNMLEC